MSYELDILNLFYFLNTFLKESVLYYKLTYVFVYLQQSIFARISVVFFILKRVRVVLLIYLRRFYLERYFFFSASQWKMKNERNGDNKISI